jgi:hypothetical protein
MKDQLQKELKEKVRPGVKPSQLKRSKSLNDITSSESQIPQAPPLPQSIPLDAEKQILTEQLALKQKEIEALRQKLEVQPSAQELDQSLLARHQNLKD